MAAPTLDDAGGDIFDWLSGARRWERILGHLHEQAEGAAPVASSPTADGAPAATARAGGDGADRAR